MQKAFNNLKEGPKEDKVAVASGIAVSVVVVLLAAWAIYFFRSIQTGAQRVDLSGGAQDQFNFTNVSEAQRQLQEQFGSSTQDLRDIHNQSQGASGEMQFQQMETQGNQTDQFGTPTY